MNSDQNINDTGKGEALKAWVVCRYLGVSSEIWMNRQILGFESVRPEIICWALEGDGVVESFEQKVHVLPFEPNPDNGPDRWWRRFVYLIEGNFLGAIGKEYRALNGLLESTKPKVILAHFGHMALRVLPSARKKGIPVVAHFHGLDVSSALRNRWYRWSLKRSLGQFAAIVVVGSHQRDWMLENGVPAEKLHLIPCGVPTAEFTPTDRKDSGGPLRLVAASRLVRWKGVEETIRALAVAKERGVDARLDILGDGYQKDFLQKLCADLNLAEVVTFHGSQNPEQVRTILSESDVFVQHSLTDPSGWVEGFGVSLAEGAAMELPVIATRSGGIPDQVVDGETGILIPERDITRMADAIQQMAENPGLRKKLGVAGRKRMITFFDTKKQIAELEKVMTDVALRP